MRKEKKEDIIPFTDPQAFLTRNLAERSKHVDERSRVNSYEQYDYFSYNLFLFSQLGVRMFFDSATIDMRLMISKDGKSREEMVEGLKGLNEQQRGFNTGFSVVTEAIESQKARQK